MGVGLALGSGAEGREMTCGIQLGPRGFAHQHSLLSSYIQTHSSPKVDKHFSILAE